MNKIVLPQISPKELEERGYELLREVETNDVATIFVDAGVTVNKRVTTENTSKIRIFCKEGSDASVYVKENGVTKKSLNVCISGIADSVMFVIPMNLPCAIRF